MDHHHLATKIDIAASEAILRRELALDLTALETRIDALGTRIDALGARLDASGREQRQLIFGGSR